MKNPKQITKKQHWSPKSYLKRFADSANFLKVLDVKNWKIIKPQSYAGVCYGHFFYGQETGVYDEMSQCIEDYFQHIETAFNSKFDRIVKNIFSTTRIEDQHLHEIAFFMATLWIRSKHQRKKICRMIGIFSRARMSRIANCEPYIQKCFDEIEKRDNEKISSTDRNDTIEIIKSQKYKVEADNRHHHLWVKTSLEGKF